MNDQMVAAALAEGVTVRYGRNTAVDNVTFAIQRGTVYALLGRNGAGKSSLVRCLLGQQKPQRGRVELFGQDVWRDRHVLMERVGIVAEEADAPPEMRVDAIAAFCRRLYSRWDQGSFDDRMRRFGIPQNRRFGDLSKGQKKEVGLALALSSAPELVVLDDPTLGLDVVARKSLFEEVIAELADRGITVLVTTHDLAGVETIADRVGVLSGGKLVIDEELESLKARFRRVRTTGRTLVAAGGEAQAGVPVPNMAAVRAWGSGTEAVITNYDDVTFERFRSGGDAVEVTPMSLEEIFVAVAGEEGAQQ